MFADVIDATDTEAREVRFRIHGDGYTPRGSAVPEPWDIAELTASSIKLTRCHFMRGPVTVWGAADLSCELSGSGDVTVAAKIDTEDHAVTLVAGGSGTAWDASVNESSKYYLLPRYVLNRAGETGGWSVILDCRNLPQMGIYV